MDELLAVASDATCPLVTKVHFEVARHCRAGRDVVLIGHAEGSQVTFELRAADAYGERNPDLVQKLTRALVQQHAGSDQDLTAGKLVDFAAPGGGSYAGVFKGWEGEHAVFDFNHPLAGTDLRLEVDIKGVL